MPEADPALLAVTIFGIIVLLGAIVLDASLNAKARRTVHTMRAAGWAYAMPWAAIGVGFLLLGGYSLFGLITVIASGLRSWHLRKHARDYLPGGVRRPFPTPAAGHPLPGYGPPVARR